MNVLVPDFLRALRRWASGVSVVTSEAGGAPTGMTVSAFMSVSLEPPLVAVCLANNTPTLAALRQTRAFAVNVLAANQAELSNVFSTRTATDRFEQVAHVPGPARGMPLLQGTAAGLECRLEAAHAAGDHTLCVGEVLAATTAEPLPLLYFEGAYRELSGSGAA